MGYLEMVKADVEQWVSDNMDLEFDIMNGNYDDADDIEQDLNDRLWAEDSVTGNASGSYTFNRYDAQENVIDNIDEVQEAYEELSSAEEFGHQVFAGDWEAIDVTTRCYFLGQAIAEFMEENEDIITSLFEQYESQGEDDEEEDSEEVA